MKTGEAWFRRLGCAAALLWPLATATAGGPEADGGLSVESVLEMEIEALLDLDVTSIVKKETRLFDVAAATTVLTAEDIRRSGHTALAEMLRLVPGFHVAHIDANKWSVSSRGFAGRFTDKLLVLQDGRSVYTPVFGGVFWDVQDTFQADLDRIEVIRGPGATLWGANAVNGVVNILTKSAKDTQGLLFTGGGGHIEQGLFGARYGGAIGERTWYRVFAQGFLRDDFAAANGGDTSDEWWQARGGFRVDWEKTDDDTVTVQGEIYKGQSGEQVTLPTLAPPHLATQDSEENVAGGHVRARWRRVLDESSDWELKFHLDVTDRRNAFYDELRHTAALEFQHRMALGTHDLLWGAGYSATHDDFRNNFTLAFNPTERTDHLVHAFVQDEFAIIADVLIATVGTKLEHNDYTGFEAQPSARLLWKIDDRRSLWGAVSRAVRTPTRADEDLFLRAVPLAAGPPPVFAGFLGSGSIRSEDLLAFELGHRVRPRGDLLIDVALFYNAYDDLTVSEPGAPIVFADHVVVPSVFSNIMDGETYGGELSVDWRPHERVRIVTGYSFLRMQLHAPGSVAPNPEGPEGRSPRHMANVRVSLDAGRRWEFDIGVYYVDRLSDLGVPSYVRLDARVGWRPDEKTLVELIVRNALDDRHPEYTSELPFTQGTEPETAAFLRLSRRW